MIPVRALRRVQSVLLANTLMRQARRVSRALPARTVSQAQKTALPAQLERTRTQVNRPRARLAHLGDTLTRLRVLTVTHALPIRCSPHPVRHCAILVLLATKLRQITPHVSSVRPDTTKMIL
jgi:hypothetical protein